MYRVRLNKIYKGRLTPKNAKRNFRDLIVRISNRLDAAVAEELASKTYKNRTGKLAGGTTAILLMYSNDGFHFILKQGAFYGRYVQALGYSNFEEIAVRARKSIDGMVRRFTG